LREKLEYYGDKVVIATKFGFDMINNKKEDYGGSFMCASWHLLYEDCVKIYK
jgi:hypothetical protein